MLTFKFVLGLVCFRNEVCGTDWTMRCLSIFWLAEISVRKLTNDWTFVCYVRYIWTCSKSNESLTIWISLFVVNIILYSWPWMLLKYSCCHWLEYDIFIPSLWSLSSAYSYYNTNLGAYKRWHACLLYKVHLLLILIKYVLNFLSLCMWCCYSRPCILLKNCLRHWSEYDIFSHLLAT